MMQMNQQWMNPDRQSPEYIAGMEAFLEVAKANENPKGFMCGPCSLCRNDKVYSDWGTLHLHLIKNGFITTRKVAICDDLLVTLLTFVTE
jgi:hypothetical protein